MNINKSDIHLKVLRQIEINPAITQRELAQQLGVSLGKVNYCLKALIDKGWVKVNNFRSSANKRAYLYLLTPRGIEERARVTARFLRVKLDEYEILKRELEELEREAALQEKPGQAGMREEPGRR